MSAARPAVFLDRDGTLNREVGYLSSVVGLRVLPGVPAALRRLREAGFTLVVVSNQSGVARGYMTIDTMRAINRELVRRLGERGATLDGVYVCPHHPREGVPPLRRRCRCRKPAPGLVKRAARDLGIDLGRSYCVGDQRVDVALAAACGVRAVLVLTGQGRATARALAGDLPVAHVAPNFPAAAKWIIDDAQRSAWRHRR